MREAPYPPRAKKIGVDVRRRERARDSPRRALRPFPPGIRAGCRRSTRATTRYPRPSSDADAPRRAAQRSTGPETAATPIVAPGVSAGGNVRRSTAASKRAPSGPVSRILFPDQMLRRTLRPPRPLSGTAIIPLGPRSPSGSSSRPGNSSREVRRDGRPLSPYLALLRMGFTVPPPLPAERCALTAPFHPCRPFGGRRFVFCGTFLRVAATGCYPACRPCGVRTFLPGPLVERSPERSRGPLGAGAIVHARVSSTGASGAGV